MSTFDTIGVPEKLGSVMEFVRQSARTAAFNEEDLLRIDLIVEEVFLNIAMHGYPDRQSGAVTIHCDSPQAGVLTIQLQDWAEAFNPLAGESAPLDVPLSERREGGLGLVLVTTMAESVSYRRIDDRNELTVRIVSAAAKL
jgi:serine/threonine-protein kinase RsbW